MDYCIYHFQRICSVFRSLWINDHGTRCTRTKSAEQIHCSSSNGLGNSPNTEIDGTCGTPVQVVNHGNKCRMSEQIGYDNSMIRTCGFKICSELRQARTLYPFWLNRSVLLYNMRQ